MTAITWKANRVLDGVCHLRGDRMARVLAPDTGGFIAETRTASDPVYVSVGTFNTLDEAKAAA